MKKKSVLLLSALFALPVIAGTALAFGGANQLALQEAAKPNAGDATPAAIGAQTQIIPATNRNQALIKAADRGDADAVNRLLKEGADKNATNGFGATALYAAAGNADPAATERLLAEGADPNTRLFSGETPLMEAAYRGNTRVVQALLKAHANADAQESNGGESAMMWAIQQRHPDIATALIQAGAKVDSRSKRGMTALMFAAQQNDARSAALLLKAHADPNAVAPDEGRSALIIAGALGNAEAVHVLVANKADTNVVDNLGYTALIYAAHINSATALVEDLLDHGADPNARISKDAPNLETRSGITFYGASALAMAAHINNYGVIEALIKHGADPKIATERGVTPLMMAAECAYQQNLARPAEERATALKTIKLLVAHGAKVDTVGQFNVTAVHCAAMQGLNDVIAFLASKGASVDLKDDAGQTPLSIAEGIVTKAAMLPRKGQNSFPRFGRKDTAKLLLQLGATPLEKSGVEIAMRREG